jgi:hypothetical protein
MRAVKTGLVAAVLLLGGCHGGSRPVGDGEPSTPTGPAASSAAAPAVAVGDTKTLEQTTVYYRDDSRLYALRGSVKRVVGQTGEQQNVSPDGKHIVTLDDKGLIITDITGRDRHTIEVDVPPEGFGSSSDAGPYWTADSRSVIVVRSDGVAGTVRISDGAFKAFPEAIQGHDNYRISGDGKRVLYLDKCTIYSARTDGGDIKRVPGIGARSTAENPSRLEACVLGTVNSDGSRVAAVIFRMTDGNKEAGRVPERLVDTTTGKVLPLAVRGQVVGVLIRGDGSLVVRSTEDNEKYVLTLLSATGTEIAHKAEPAIARAAVLNSYSD